ncbi:MAG: Zn-dependent oligopeptidase [Dehalococcoidia bacterium]|nr:Zn-dependent oligopeptidase [Dehalococcoidia bacterium]
MPKAPWRLRFRYAGGTTDRELPMAADSLDLVDFAALTPDALERACRDAMAACDAALERIVAVPAGERTFANTMLAMEEATEPVGLASGAYAFMAYVSADDALREKARELDQEIDQYSVALSFREDLYEAVRAFAATPEAQALDGEAKRALAFDLRDYRRNGFELPREQRARVRAIMDELVALDVQFRNAIDDWDDAIEVTREQLAGLPDSFIERLKTVERGAVTKYRVSLDYPELHPFMSNAADESLRRELFLKDQRKGGLENVERLEKAIALRNEAATLLGYDSWAAYRVETRMAKQRQQVDAFLADLREKVARKAGLDFEGLREAKGGEVHIWDWRYYHNELLKTRYAVDEFEVAQYFPLDACLDGLFAVTQSMLGVRYEPAPAAPRWHPDVQVFDIYEADAPAGTEPFARFYMDLFPRPNKYGHAAAFTLRRGRLRPDGTYQRPVSAIVANFTKPSATEPSLLRHTEVVTLFHEFGHILHQTLTRAQRARFSGTATERDFVEAPSQMLEHWCWEPEVLASFARHYQTGEPLPQALLEAMIAAKNLDSGVMTLRQLFFASLDFAYHSPGFAGDTTLVVRELHPITGFPYPDGTYFQSGFGHLFGYDAGYYGYLWSHVFGDDMYTRFEATSPLDRSIGAHYRTAVLERGGSVDGDQLVRDFLGREPNSDAFLRGLGL